jgi:glutamate formiminotransferase
MKRPLYEIVPNLSEGRERTVIDNAVAAAAATGARVLHRTSDVTHHRSVLTIVGDDRQVLEAAVAVAGVAIEYVDLRVHRGVHPRIGALDVLPFVPLGEGAEMARAIELAHRAAERIWERYRVPSFFYAEAATRADRRALPDVRRGEFEGLDERVAAVGGAFDVGTQKHPSAGAIAIGARPVLVAFNVELRSGDFVLAKRIAASVRERNGGLRTIRALAFPMENGHVQVSLNVTDYNAVPLYRIVETIRALARDQGAEIERCELIGCLPLDAVRTTAHYYIGRAGA